MLRKSLFSLFAGSAFAVMLAFSTSAMAGCQGYCADRTVDGGSYAGCTMYYDSNDKLTKVECAYTSVRVIDNAEAAQASGAS